MISPPLSCLGALGGRPKGPDDSAGAHEMLMLLLMRSVLSPRRSVLTQPHLIGGRSPCAWLSCLETRFTREGATIHMHPGIPLVRDDTG